MRVNRIRLDEPVRPRGRTPYPPAFYPPPVPPPLPPGLGRKLKRLIQEDTPVYFNELELNEYLSLTQSPQLHVPWLQQLEPEEFTVGPRPFPPALYSPPSPPASIPIPPPRLKRTLQYDEVLEFTKAPKPYPLALHPTAPPQFLTGTTSLAITVTFNQGTLTTQITGVESLQIDLAFGSGALLLRPFTLFIDGVDQTDLLVVNTLQVTLNVSQVGTAQFGLWDPTGNPANLPQVGQTVLIYRNTVRVFGGYIEKPAQGQFMALSGSMFMGSTANGSGGQVTASDFSSLLDRRYIGKYYTGPTTLQSIVSDILDLTLAADGFSYNTVDGDPGVDLGNQLFDWVTIRQAFNTLSSLTGWDFEVDAFMTIRFFPAGDRIGVAPFNIADNDGNTLAESMTITYDRTTYRNKQGVRGSSGSGSLWSDIFSAAHPGPFPNGPQPPDGHRIVFFTLDFINATPVVTLNGNPQKVASILDIAAHLPSTVGWQWAWDPPQGGFPGGDFVEQNTSNPPIKSTDVLIVSYATQVSPIIWVQNDAQIAARAAIEGNTGVYEDIQQVPTTMTDPAAQLLYAEALLARYGSGIPYEVDYMTDRDGLMPGQSQSIQQTTPPVDLTLGLITQVQMKDVDKTFFRYTVAVVSGEYLGKDAAQFFAQILNQSQLPQPANRNNYAWQLAPSYPGITNPGYTSVGVLAQQYVVQHTVELVLSLTFFCQNPATQGAYGVELLINASGTGELDLQANQIGPTTLYFSNLQVKQGDILAIQIHGVTGSNHFSDATVVVTTAVLVT